MWYFKKPDGSFDIARISSGFNIYYHDETMDKYVSPDRIVMQDSTP
jgi:hypothetical protein